MSDSFIQIQPDGAGKLVDSTQTTVGANTVYRQRMVAVPDLIAGVSYVATSALAGNAVLKSGAGVLYRAQMIVPALASPLNGPLGFMLLLDATSAPGDGVSTPAWVEAIEDIGNGCGRAVAEFKFAPLKFTSGIVAVYTTAATPFTQTSGSGAAFFGQLL